jgi:hypothetical protein
VPEYLVTGTDVQDAAIATLVAIDNAIIDAQNAALQARRDAGEPDVSPDLPLWTVLRHVQENIFDTQANKRVRARGVIAEKALVLAFQGASPAKQDEALALLSKG